jgi:RND family efflux transporter MFP subunit
MKDISIASLRVVLPLAVLVGAGLGGYAIFQTRPEVAIASRAVELPGVRVHEVVLSDLALSVTSHGTIAPRTESQLVPEIAGQVLWVSPSFASGGFFEEGETLLRIDQYDYAQTLITAQSQLTQARLRLTQEEAEAVVARREWQELGRGAATPLTLREPQMADARAAVAAADANLDRARRDLERADIKAPYAGRVREKNVDIGQFVTVGAPVARIYAVDRAEVRLPLPDSELAFLDLPLAYRGQGARPGPNVILRSEFAGKTHEWRGRIVRTEAEIDPVSRMVHAVAEVADPYAQGLDPSRPPLAVGMFVEAEIEGRTASQVAVLPRAALRGRDQMLVVDATDRIQFRRVEVFRATSQTVVVSSGLEAGERVLVSALEAATEGMQVQVLTSDGSA